MTVNTRSRTRTQSYNTRRREMTVNTRSRTRTQSYNTG